MANAFAASPRPLTPCSLKTLIASITPLNGATTNLRMALPTPTTPSIILGMSPLDCTKADAFVIRSAAMFTTFSRMPLRNLKTGSRETPALLTAAIVVSSSLRVSARDPNRATTIPRIVITGLTARASNPSLRPPTPPDVALSPLSRASRDPENVFINPG